MSVSPGGVLFDIFHCQGRFHAEILLFLLQSTLPYSCPSCSSLHLILLYFRWGASLALYRFLRGSIIYLSMRGVPCQNFALHLVLICSYSLCASPIHLIFFHFRWYRGWSPGRFPRRSICLSVREAWGRIGMFLFVGMNCLDKKRTEEGMVFRRDLPNWFLVVQLFRPWLALRWSWDYQLSLQLNQHIEQYGDLMH